MAFDVGDPLRWRESLPSRQPASSEVAAGAVAGILGGLVAWGAAIALSPSDVGALLPLRLVAATLSGTAAVAPGGSVLHVLAGAFLASLASVTYGLVFVSILRPATPVGRAVIVGAVYGAALYVPAWPGVVHVFDPLLYEAGGGRAFEVVALHVLYGTVLGLVVPVLRKVLP